MASVVLVVAVIAFLSGAVTAIFVMLVIGVRKGDRPERILGARSSSLGACARTVLRSSTRPDSPFTAVIAKPTDLQSGLSITAATVRR